MRTRFVSLAAVTALLVSTSAHAVDPAVKCETSKLKEVAKYASCRLKAEAKGVQTNTTPDFSTCEGKFTPKFTSLDTKFGTNVCPSEGDEASINSRITSDANDIAILLSGGTVPGFQAAAIAPGLVCESGGVRLAYGTDDDGDGTLEASEVDVASIVCTGGEDPAACYAFDGDASDAFGGLGGALVGGTSFVPGLQGDAVHFDGASGYVALPPHRSVDFSIAGFIYLDAPPGAWARFFEQGIEASPNNGTMFVTLNDGIGNLQGRLWQGAVPNLSTTTPTPSTGAWHHIVFTYDQGGAGMTVFLDGAPVASAAYNATGAGDWGDEIALHLGHSFWPLDPGQFLQGAFDEGWVFERVLSPAEVTQLYNAGSGLPCSAGLP